MYAKQNRGERESRDQSAGVRRRRRWQEGEGGQLCLPVSVARRRRRPTLPSCLSLKQFESTSTCNYLE